MEKKTASEISAIRDQETGGKITTEDAEGIEKKRRRFHRVVNFFVRG